jgi:HSP20 family protein
MPHDPSHHDHRFTSAVAGLNQEIAWMHPDAEPPAPLDIEERDDALVVQIDLPGVSERELTVSCDGRDLTVRGERRAREQGHVYHRERLFGPFERTVTLKCAVDETAMRASYRAGVLEIHLPRAKTCTAPIKVEQEQ